LKTGLKICLIILIICALGISVAAQSQTRHDLEQCLTIALENNPELLGAAEVVKQAEADIGLARTAWWPTIELVGTASQVGPEIWTSTGPGSSVLSNDDGWDGTASLQYSHLLYDFEQTRRRIRMASLATKATKQDLINTTNKVVYETTSGFYNVLMLEELVRVSKEDVERNETLLKATETRLEVGDAPEFEVLRAKVALSNSVEGLVSARKNLNVARVNLRRMMNVDYDFEIDAPIKSDIPGLKTGLGDVLQLTMDHRPDLLGLELTVRSLDKNVKSGWSWPYLTLGGQYNFHDEQDINEDYYVGVMLTIPIFDGGLGKAQVKKNKAMRDEARQGLEALIDAATLEVSDAYFSVEEAEQRLRTSEATVESAREAQRMAEIGFKEGAVSYIDYVDAQANFTLAQGNYLSNYYGLLIARATLNRAVGIHVD